MILRIIRKFSSAHRLPQYDGDCSRLHGHTWRAVFEIEGEIQPNGMVYDFKLLKPILDEALPDHKFLNDLYPNPTAENLCTAIFAEVSKILAEKNLKLKTLEIWENEDCASVIRVP